MSGDGEGPNDLCSIRKVQEGGVSVSAIVPQGSTGSGNRLQSWFLSGCGERCSWNSPLGTQISLTTGELHRVGRLVLVLVLLPLISESPSPCPTVASAHAGLPHCRTLSGKVSGACKHHCALEWVIFIQHFLYVRCMLSKHLPIHISFNSDHPSPYFSLVWHHSQVWAVPLECSLEPHLSTLNYLHRPAPERPLSSSSSLLAPPFYSSPAARRSFSKKSYYALSLL